jgi:fructose-bisphosphate aldolase class II
MYVSMKHTLRNAHRDGYAVMAINCANIEMVRGAVRAAEESRAPLIINIGVGQMRRHAKIGVMVPVVRTLAEEATIPVSLNLDHSPSVKIVVQCIQAGFNSVMLDTSKLPYAENLAHTCDVVAYAAPFGIGVEAELGHVGFAAAGDEARADYLTDPTQALDFVQRTNVDALAVAIGTAHGSYPSNRVPELDFDRLIELKRTLDMPLVLHGGSGAGEANIRRAVELGINKINVATDAFDAAKTAMLQLVAEDPGRDYIDMMAAAETAVHDFVADYLPMTGSVDRCGLMHSEGAPIE